MYLKHILHIVLASVLGGAFLIHFIVVIALKGHGVDIDFARSIKPGIIENAYRYNTNAHSRLLGVLVRLSGFTRLVFVFAAIAFFLLRRTHL